MCIIPYAPEANQDITVENMLAFAPTASDYRRVGPGAQEVYDSSTSVAPTLTWITIS